MQLTDRSAQLAIPPIWRLGFRPFFLAGAAFAVVSIALWIAALSGVFHWQPAGGWLAWHRHEMVFGFAVAVVAGFLLTAVQNWTGVPMVNGKPLAGIALVWLLARLAWLSNMPPWLILLLEAAFLPLVAYAVGRNLWQVKQQRNYPVVGILIVLALMNVLSALGLCTGNDDWQRRGALSATWGIGAMMILIGGRVIPFFTQRGLGRAQQVPAIAWLDRSLLIGCMVIAVAIALGFNQYESLVMGLLFLALGIGQLVRLGRWYDNGIWRVPLLWPLHLAYLWSALAALGMALWHFGIPLNPSLALHALTVGGIGGLILAMTARVTLGHTGRPLISPKTMPWAFALLNIGCLARIILPGVTPLHAWHLAALCWIAGFGLYLISYAPMLCQARVDGHPG